ncbi:hypothetical protein FPV67DRAFT_1657124 [Lyophyllum atratum]|nr:hypothetical protein FPV67DRAFT_1657124 [Lyophyllum atratum]
MISSISIWFQSGLSTFWRKIIRRASSVALDIHHHFMSTESGKELAAGQLYETQGPTTHLHELLNDCVPVYDPSGEVIGYVCREQNVTSKRYPKPVLGTPELNKYPSPWGTYKTPKPVETSLCESKFCRAHVTRQVPQTSQVIKVISALLHRKRTWHEIHKSDGGRKTTSSFLSPQPPYSRDPVLRGWDPGMISMKGPLHLPRGQKYQAQGTCQVQTAVEVDEPTDEQCGGSSTPQDGQGLVVTAAGVGIRSEDRGMELINIEWFEGVVLEVDLEIVLESGLTIASRVHKDDRNGNHKQELSSGP